MLVRTLLYSTRLAQDLKCGMCCDAAAHGAHVDGMVQQALLKEDPVQYNLRSLMALMRGLQTVAEDLSKQASLACMHELAVHCSILPYWAVVASIATHACWLISCAADSAQVGVPMHGHSC